jgi:hypothetical protein
VAPPNSPPSRMEEDGSVLYLKFCNILKWSATVRKITEGLFRNLKYSTL